MGNSYEKHHPGDSGARYEELLNHFVDGVLSSEAQVELFEHLSQCEHCREQLDAIMTFRRISRLEFLQVPPSVDDAFFKKLAAHRPRTAEQKDVDRSILSANVAVSLRTVLVAASVVFIVGLFLPSNMASGDTKIVETRQERVDLSASSVSFSVQEAVYVFYPGLTITAELNAEEADLSLISIHH